MALEPITRQEKIIAGQDLEPITRMEMFLKQFCGGGGGGGSADAVLYTPQTLTDVQKKQARENIDAASVFVVNGAPNQGGTVTLDKTLIQINEAANSGKNVFSRITAGNFIACMPLVQNDSGTLKEKAFSPKMPAGNDTTHQTGPSRAAC